MNFRIHHKPVTASTNQDARAGAHGDVYTADAQTAGRGRLDHRWLSAPGANLMLSAVFDVAGLAPEQVATFPLVVGLAAHAAVSRMLATVPDVPPVRLKWPNDLLVGGRKIAGILCERHADAVIAGVGVNVNETAFPPEIAARATSLAAVRGAAEAAGVVRLRDVLLEELGVRYGTWRAEGFAAFQAHYAAVDWLKGRTVAVRQTDDDAAPLVGLCWGVQPDGTLLVGGTPVFAGEAHVVGVGDGCSFDVGCNMGTKEIGRAHV